MRNFSLEFDNYIYKIQSVLIHKYKLNSVNAYDLLREYNFFSDIYDSDKEHFFYYSPEYWADYIFQ